MARRRKAFEEWDVLRLLLDPILGLVGALMTLFLIQVAMSTNSIDRDLALKLDQATNTVERLTERAQIADANGALAKAWEGDAKVAKHEVTECQAKLSEAQQTGVVCQVSKSECERNLGASGDARELGKTIATLKEQCRAAAAGGVAITTSMLPTAVANRAYSLTLAAEGGVLPFHWSLSGALPDGLQLDPDRGVISGIAKVAGNSEISVTVRDSSKEVSSSSRSLSMDVVQAGMSEQSEKTTSLPWWAWLLVLAPAIMWVLDRIRRWLWIRELKSKGLAGQDISVSFHVPS